MNPVNPKDGFQARDLVPKHSGIIQPKPVIDPVRALIADLDRLRDMGSTPANRDEGQLESWQDSREIYLEFELEDSKEIYLDLSVFAGKVFIRVPR